MHIYAFLFLLSYFASIAQVKLLDFNFPLALVLILNSRLSFSKGVFLAFCGGLFQDAFQLRILGTSSLFYLFILSFLPLLAYRFSFKNPLSRLFLYFIIGLVWEKLLGHGWVIIENMIMAVLVFFFSKNEEEKIKI